MGLSQGERVSDCRRFHQVKRDGRVVTSDACPRGCTRPGWLFSCSSSGPPKAGAPRLVAALLRSAINSLAASRHP